MTMLEKAGRAVNDAESQWSLEPTGTRSEMIARAVLMAVRNPDEALSRAVQSTEGWEAMIDAILNEGSTK